MTLPQIPGPLFLQSIHDYSLRTHWPAVASRTISNVTSTGFCPRAEPPLCHLARMVDQTDVHIRAKCAVRPRRNESLADEDLGHERFNSSSVVERSTHQASHTPANLRIADAVGHACAFERSAEVLIGAHPDDQRVDVKVVVWSCRGLEQAEVRLSVGADYKVGAGYQPGAEPNGLGDLRLRRRDVPTAALSVGFGPHRMTVKPRLAVAQPQCDAPTSRRAAPVASKRSLK